MSDSHDYQTEAIVIKKTKLGEADRILTLYTPHFGKIQAVAKGVRRPKSKMAGHLELLTHSMVSLARGRNLDTITGSQTISGFLLLKSDLWLTSCGLYITELVNQFTSEQVEDHRLFQLLLSTLEHLSQGSKNGMVLRYFELHLLREAGYQPQLHDCVSCHKRLEPVANSFSPPAGGVLCPRCAPEQAFAYSLSVNAQKVLRLFQNSDFEVASRVKADQALSMELEEVMRLYIRYLLEREVKSVAWLDALREGTFSASD